MMELAVYVPEAELSIVLPAEIIGSAENPMDSQTLPAPELSVYLPDQFTVHPDQLIEVIDIPLLPASQIASGMFDPDRLPPIPADKILWPSDDTDSTKIFFSFGDASPKPIYLVQPDQTIFTITIVIQIPFNGTDVALMLGDEEIGDRLMQAGQVDPNFAAEYETNPGYTYSAETQISLTITPGEGCTQGSGYVLLEV